MRDCLSLKSPDLVPLIHSEIAGTPLIDVATRQYPGKKLDAFVVVQNGHWTRFLCRLVAGTECVVAKLKQNKYLCVWSISRMATRP